jgi:seryl-tRNA synthetase
MLDLKFIRENAGVVKKALEKRGDSFDLARLLEIDKEHRIVLQELEVLRHQRKKANKEMANIKKVSSPSEEVLANMKTLSQNIKELEDKERALASNITDICLAVPNIPDETVPLGSTEKDNVEVRRWGNPAGQDFKPASHIDIGEKLGILDFSVSAKLTGSGFAFFRGHGARLVRGLINFMIDTHVTKHGYTEVFPPFVVNRECMTGTGQLPKLEEDMYRIESDDLFLIPTAEVPVTNIHREEILEKQSLPLFYTAYTACFRREAGSHGRETRGLVRLHQFDKVELVKLVEPATSDEELEKLLGDAEDIIQALGLHYRVISLCAGDLSFASSKCYDIEIWSPGLGRYLEVSSCSNFKDFQARRAGIRYRPAPGEKPEYVHTLNGSGVALPRLIASLLETNQKEDGTVQIPPPLRPYMGGMDVIS